MATISFSDGGKVIPALNAEVFVLNYNGRDLLLECLPSILEAVRASAYAAKVTVIDNQSTDDSLGILRERFPEVRVYTAEANRVLCSFNPAVRASAADIVFLLNNDIKTDKDFIDPLMKAFEEYPDAFLAAPKAFTFDQKRYEGCLSKIFFSGGIFGAMNRFPGYEDKINRSGLTMQAGFGAFRRDRFLELGGYDDLYLPGTVEDSDLCFRAWKAGYRCYYEPRSVVYHKGQASFKKSFGPRRLLAINQRNLHLFVWKNVSDPGFIAGYLLWFLIRPLLFLFRGRIEFIWGVFWAVPRLCNALRKRRMSVPARARRSDREIFAVSEGI